MKDSLTLGEIEQIETLARAPISALDDAKAPKGRLLTALALVVTRRTTPTATWEDAQKLTIDEVQAMAAKVAATTPDPT